MSPPLSHLLDRLLRRPPGGPRGQDREPPRPAPGGHRDGSAPPSAGPYPGDFEGSVEPRYSPEPDGRPDPGEVAWTWVPYEEDHTRGKDRPVLLVGSDGPWLLALPLTSKDHDRDAAQEARVGRHWVDVGTGGWDSRGRPSEARVDRVVRVDPAAVRREGAVLPPERWADVVAALRAHRS